MSERLNVLLLVESLPNPADRDSIFWIKNSFVFDAMKRLALRHALEHPLFVPYCARLVAGFYRGRGMEIHFPSRRDGAVESILEKTVRYPFLPRLYPWIKYRALRRALDLSRFDLIHCHTVYDLGLAGLRAARDSGKPLVVTVYGSDVNWLFETGERMPDGYIAESTRRVLRGADAVVCVSRDLAARVQSLGVDRERTFWIPNGFDGSVFHPGDARAEREKLGWPRDGKVLLFVGNLFETKGLGDLVEALGLLRKDGRLPKDFRCLVAGRSTPWGESLKGRLAELGLDNCFEFCGLVPPRQVASMMRACDLFCLPSWREGWPCVVVEALACGAPVVGTDIGGINELVTDSTLGLLCPARDPKALAGRIGEALGRPWDRERIGASVKEYEYGRVTEKIEEVYRRVLRR